MWVGCASLLCLLIWDWRLLEQTPCETSSFLWRKERVRELTDACHPSESCDWMAHLLNFCLLCAKACHTARAQVVGVGMSNSTAGRGKHD